MRKGLIDTLPYRARVHRDRPVVAVAGVRSVVHHTPLQRIAGVAARAVTCRFHPAPRRRARAPPRRYSASASPSPHLRIECPRSRGGSRDGAGTRRARQPDHHGTVRSTPGRRQARRGAACSRAVHAGQPTVTAGCRRYGRALRQPGRRQGAAQAIPGRPATVAFLSLPRNAALRGRQAASRVGRRRQADGAAGVTARRELRANNQPAPDFDVDAHRVRCTVYVRPDWPGNVTAP